MDGVIIAKSQHHINKAFYLQKALVNQKIEIFAFNTKRFKGKHYFGAKTRVRAISNFKSLRETFSNIKYVIIFGFHADKHNLYLLKLAKSLNVKIILFQETHMLTTHMGKIYNIIFDPDYLIPTSKLEKRIIENQQYFPASKIRYFGNIFGSKYLNFLDEKISTKQENKLLIVFSAPSSLDPISGETFLQRLEIINFFKLSKQYENITLRIHPFEDRSDFRKFLAENNIDYKLDNHDVSLFKTSFNYVDIVSSVKSESIFELVYNSESNLYIYSINGGSPIHDVFSFEKEIFQKQSINLSIKLLESNEIRNRLINDLCDGEEEQLEKLNNFFSKVCFEHSTLSLIDDWDDYFLKRFKSFTRVRKIFDCNLSSFEDERIFKEIDTSDSFSAKTLKTQAVSQFITLNFGVRVSEEIIQSVSERTFTSVIFQNFKVQSLILWQYIKFHDYTLDFSTIEIGEESLQIIEKDFYKKNFISYAMTYAFEVVEQFLKIRNLNYLLRSYLLKFIMKLK